MNERVMTAGGYVSGKIGIRIPFTENPIAEKVIARINAITKKFIKDVENNKKPLFLKFYTYIAVNVFFKPFIMKYKDHYEGVLKSWKKKGLIK